MKGFTIETVKKDSGVNNYFIAPHPFHKDFFTVVNKFNKINNEIESGYVFFDLMTLIGNRENRFISAVVNDYKLDVSSIKSVGYYGELEEFTKNSYAKLAKNTIKLVYPIDFREEILKIKERQENYEKYHLSR
ncbi:hypothetical protein LLS04_06745 [Erysipelothrix enhydrae]|uniref:hypothetical protein n=1 Tax=Erysipelothrix enhydrae TaxID=2890314 RepID=UPI002B245AC2|nr:hypothetical protein [Erysipelothrix sp. 4322-04]WRB86670.1 hypothetical protein LLS04_06745 [Erysipelothrix sp. 4322-04]